MRKVRIGVLLLALAVLMSLIVYGNVSKFTENTDAAYIAKQKDDKDDIVEPSANLPMNIPDLVNSVKNSIVNISTTTVVKFKKPQFRSPFGRDPFDDFFRDFFGRMPSEQKRRSLGSGCIVSEDGYILTNNHVVQRADEITVKLYDERELPAEVIGSDPKTDIALIKIKNDGKLPSSNLGDSDSLKVGEWVVAIGNPFGLEHTVTTGIVSAKGRVIGSGPYDDFIQTDASINPGNSGGPLFNLKGEVVGINTAIVQGGQGIGFAIPINIAKDVFAQLKEKGKVVRGWLGVYMQDITEDMAKSFNLKSKDGVIITEVITDSPAERAGLKESDVLIEFDGKKVKDVHQLPALVAAITPGTEVAVKIIRDGKQKNINVKLGEMPGEEDLVSKKTDNIGELGLVVQDISDEIAKFMEIEDTSGVIVSGVESGSPSDDAGIRERDIIRQVNRKQIKDLTEFREALKNASGEGSVLFLIERGERRLFVVVKKK
jgi:serine protease Do